MDTTKAAVHKGLSGYLSLSIAQLLNHGTTYKIQVYMYQGRLPEPKSPGGTCKSGCEAGRAQLISAGVRELTTIPIDRTNFSWQLRRSLENKLVEHEDEDEEAWVDVVVNLSIDSSGRLYFEAKHEGLSMGKGILRIDATKGF